MSKTRESLILETEATLRRRHHFASVPGAGLFIYSDSAGQYVRFNAGDMARRDARLLAALDVHFRAANKIAGPKDLKLLLDVLTRGTTTRLELSCEEHIPVRDGVIDLKTGKLTKFPPTELKYFGRPMPVGFDPDAECPATDAFITKTLGREPGFNLRQFYASLHFVGQGRSDLGYDVAILIETAVHGDSYPTDDLKGRYWREHFRNACSERVGIVNRIANAAALELAASDQETAA